MYRYIYIITFFLAPIVNAAEVHFEQGIDKGFRATISVYPASVDDQAGGGSGVVISPDGYALTNFHVVQPCGPAMKCAMADGELYDAVVVGLDPVGDIALIKLFPKKPTVPFPFTTLADSDAVTVGQPAIVMGNPFLLALDFKPCVSIGIVSGVHRYQFPSGSFLEYTDCIQTDAAVNPGNSGGPLFNEHGEIIGIIGRCSFEKRGRVNVGIGYAVSSNQVRFFLGDLKSGRIVDHATLNATVSTDKEGRVLISDVLPTSDAYRSGLRYDDELLRFAGRAIDTANAFKNVIGIFPKGWRLPVTIRGKAGDRYDILARLGGLHSEAELIEMTQKMIEPPIVPPELKKMLDEQERRAKGGQRGKDETPGNPDADKKNDDKLPPGFKEIEVEGPDGKKVKMLQKEHFIPDAVKPFYEKQRGYANFYFNRIELKRTLENWRNSALGKDVLKNKTASWKFSGSIKGLPSNYLFEITDKGVNYQLPLGDGFWDADRNNATTLDPIAYYQSPLGSGGLFAALYLLRQMTISDTIPQAEIVYVGTAPIKGNIDKLYDVCAVSWRGNETRFFFDPDNGSVVLTEFAASSLDAPSELYFQSIFQMVEDLETVTNELEVRYGPFMFGTFVLNDQTPPFKVNAAVTAGSRMINLPLPPTTIADAQSKIVKIYGAGGMPGVHGYQTGMLVSSEGHILTAITASLQTDTITVVLNNGRKYEAGIIDADPMTELALLKIPASELPYFEMPGPSANLLSITDAASDSFGFDDSMRIGTNVLAVSNPFNIAEGNEPASVQRGRIAARTTLRARRGVFVTPYKGPILVVDFTTNNPGACGGVLVDESTGVLLGMLGKELRNSENNSWLNFAIPTFVIRPKVLEMLARSARDRSKPLLIDMDAVTPEKELIPEDTISLMQRFGILLVTPVARRTPPFIETVKVGSVAETAGLRPDDLIVMVNNRLTSSLAAVEYQVHQTPAATPLTLTIERDMNLIDVTFK